MKYIIKNWCGTCEDFVKTITIEMADCKGFKCVNCENYTNFFRLPKYEIRRNRFRLIKREKS